MAEPGTERLTVMLLDVAKAITAKAAAAVAPLDLREVGALLAAGQLDSPSQQDIGAHTGMDRTTVGKVVADLEARGLVARQVAAPDHRRKGVTLTAAGRSALSDIDQAFETCDKDFFQPITNRDRQSLRTILARLMPGNP